MKIAVVTSLYCSADYLREFYTRITNTVSKINFDYEIVLVNDGSPDESLSVAKELLELDDKVNIIDLANNYGEHKAIMTGLSYAEADYYFIIDCDLEEAPEWIEVFWEKMKEEKDIDVVYGIQKKRKGGLFERASGNLFYSLLNLISEVKIHKNLVTARLMSDRYVKNLLKYNESEIMLFGIFALTGFNQKPVEIEKLSKGKTAYNMARKMRLAINAFVSFSSKPLLFIFNMGMLITLLSFAFVIYLLVSKIFFGIDVPGWTSVMASIWFIGGITIFSIGVLGIYLSKIFIEVKNRPFTIVKTIYGKQVESKSGGKR